MVKNQSDNRVNSKEIRKIRKIRKKIIKLNIHTDTRTARVSEWNKKYNTATTIIIILYVFCYCLIISQFRCISLI